MLREFPSVTNFVPLMVRLRLPLSAAAVIRLLMFLAIFVPSSPIKTWPCLVSFASMPSSSTTRVRKEKIIALKVNNNRLWHRFVGVLVSFFYVVALWLI